MLNNNSIRPKKTSLKDEFRAFSKFVLGNNNADISFFASQGQYMSYYDGLIQNLINVHHKRIDYLSSDSRDPIFETVVDGLFPLYADVMLSLIFPIIDTPIVTTTVPDLHQYKLKRSFSGVNYVYVFHSMVSAHMMYRLGAFDYYDTMFCVGPYHLAEIRKMESVYGLPQKDLYEVGYYRLEKIYLDHQIYLEQKEQSKEAKKIALVAPSWHEENLLNTCGDAVIASLLANGFDVILRPHPMTIAKSPALLDRYIYRFGSEYRFALDLNTMSEDYIHEADVMICDWSGVALEYAFGTERPVVFIDLPRKIHNAEYERLDITPFEVKIRDEIGIRVSPDMSVEVGKIALEFIDHAKDYREQIIQTRDANIFNFGHSSSVGAEIIIDLLKSEKKGRVV